MKAGTSAASTSTATGSAAGTQGPAAPASAPVATSIDRLVTLLGHVRAGAKAHKRADLEGNLQAAIERLRRPDTVVCVAGEFKQGKSSLINSLLGVAACPVDDDLATAAVTVVRHGPQLQISVRRRVDRKVVTEPIPVDRLAEFVTERGNPENRLGVELVEIRLPNRLLERGWAFIDTPGIGGLNPAQAAAALAFLPAANALLFVSDASAELTGGELEFLGRAREACPVVLVALSKIDLYPAWREIAAADRGHLANRGLRGEPIAVSSVLRAAALNTADRELNDESGLPTLLSELQTTVLDQASAGALARAAEDGRRSIRQLRLPLDRELAGLRDPAAVATQQAELSAARERLTQLRGPAARWGQRLNDGFSDLSAAADYGFRGSMRSILRQTEERIDASDPAGIWEDLASRLQGNVAEAVGETFTTLVDGAGTLRQELADLIRDDAIAAARESGPGVDVAELWSSKPVTGSVVKSGVGMGFGALRGAQSGVLLLGMLGNLFNLALIGPVLLGGAIAFAGKSVVDERKRQLGQRRQEARVAVRTYVDDVQFEVGTRMRDMLRELQRELRDDVAARLDELQRTLTDAATALERTLKQGEATRSARIGQLEEELRALTDLETRLARAAPPTPTPTPTAPSLPPAPGPGGSA